MQIASSGQPWQSLCFCLSGQQGISADMSVICIIPAFDGSVPAAAGIASGAIANPIEISEASRNCRNRAAVIVGTFPQRGRWRKSPALTSFGAPQLGTVVGYGATFRVSALNLPANVTQRCDE